MPQQNPTNPVLNCHSIGSRLKELPYVVYIDLTSKAKVAFEQKVFARQTFYNVLSGKTINIEVCRWLAGQLKCQIDDVLNPFHVFQDPRKIKDKPSNEQSTEFVTQNGSSK